DGWSEGERRLDASRFENRDIPAHYRIELLAKVGCLILRGRATREVSDAYRLLIQDRKRISLEHNAGNLATGELYARVVPGLREYHGDLRNGCNHPHSMSPRERSCERAEPHVDTIGTHVEASGRW